MEKRWITLEEVGRLAGLPAGWNSEQSDVRPSRSWMRSITSCNELAVRELMLRQVKKAHPEMKGVPVDVVLFALGEAPERKMTKIGGLPYRDRKLPWPVTADGRTYTFVGQLDLSESQAILPPVPSDVLLVFASEDDGDPDTFWFEWAGNVTDLIPAEEVPPPGWEFPKCYGVRCRTEDYPVEYDSVFEEAYDTDGLFVVRTYGTKIGGLPCWIQGEEKLAGEFVGQMGPVSPKAKVVYPWLNVPEPITEQTRWESQLMWGDLGGLYLFVSADGKPTGGVQYS